MTIGEYIREREIRGQVTFTIDDVRGAVNLSDSTIINELQRMIFVFQPQVKTMEITGLDREHFDELFDLYYGDLTSFVYSFVNDREVARDLVHDLFFNLWKYRNRIDPALSVKSYLFRMARNHTFNYLKHRRVVAANEKDIIEIFKQEDPNGEEWEHRLKRVRERLLELPEKQKLVVVKCCIEGKLYREVACEMKISENTVKTHLMRAMKFLREGLREDLILLLVLDPLRFRNNR